jgi:hypothetical protein
MKFAARGDLVRKCAREVLPSSRIHKSTGASFFISTTEQHKHTGEINNNKESELNLISFARAVYREFEWLVVLLYKTSDVVRRNLSKERALACAWLEAVNSHSQISSFEIRTERKKTTRREEVRERELRAVCVRARVGADSTPLCDGLLVLNIRLAATSTRWTMKWNR